MPDLTDPHITYPAACIAVLVALALFTILARRADARACEFANTTHQED